MNGGADKEINGVRVGEKGHTECRRVRGDWGKLANMTTHKEGKEWDLYLSKLQTEGKRAKKGSFHAAT